MKELDTIEDLINSKTSRRFKMRSFFNWHLNVYQDFNGLKFEFSVLNDDDNQYNWIISLHFIFWGLDYSWNSRSKKSNNDWLGNEIEKQLDEV